MEVFWVDENKGKQLVFGMPKNATCEWSNGTTKCRRPSWDGIANRCKAHKGKESGKTRKKSQNHYSGYSKYRAETGEFQDTIRRTQ